MMTHNTIWTGSSMSLMSLMVSGITQGDSKLYQCQYLNAITATRMHCDVNSKQWNDSRNGHDIFRT